MRGSSENAVRHRGRTYLMQNADAAKEFMRTPDRYSPVLSGYDPMIFLQSGQLVDGCSNMPSTTRIQYCDFVLYLGIAKTIHAGTRSQLQGAFVHPQCNE